MERGRPAARLGVEAMVEARKEVTGASQGAVVELREAAGHRTAGR